MSSYCQNSKSLKNYYGPLFKGLYLGNYRPLKSFPGNDNTAGIQEYVSRHKVTTGTQPCTGAFEPIRE
jgi:hypothetical protein